MVTTGEKGGFSGGGSKTGSSLTGWTKRHILAKGETRKPKNLTDLQPRRFGPSYIPSRHGFQPK